MAYSEDMGVGNGLQWRYGSMKWLTVKIWE